jgi:hypothetical protein
MPGGGMPPGPGYGAVLSRLDEIAVRLTAIENLLAEMRNPAGSAARKPPSGQPEPPVGAQREPAAGGEEPPAEPEPGKPEPGEPEPPAAEA